MPLSPTPSDAPAIVALLGPRTTEPDLGWTFDLARLTAEKELPVGVLRECTAELAWLARRAGQRLPEDADRQRCADAPDPALAALTLAYLHGQRLKADYRFGALAAASRDWLARFPDDALIRSYAAFSALGAGHDSAPALLERALAAADCDRQVRIVCLQGLWFATTLADQPERLLALSDEMIGRGEDVHSLYYWRASALRRRGRLDEAIASIDRAIDELPPGTTDWHQDYVRERELITATRYLDDHLRQELDTRLTEVREELQRRSAEAQRLVSRSLLGLVEVLGIFVAILGFLIGSGALVLRATGFWQSLAAIGVLAGGAIGFFLLLRLAIRLR